MMRGDSDLSLLRPDSVLDTLGLYCPVPILKTAERMKALRPGSILEVLSDDRVILIDMAAWCRSTRHQYLGSRQEGGEYHLFVRKLETA
jgi:TusA-related sulfurtransferase